MSPEDSILCPGTDLKNVQISFSNTDGTPTDLTVYNSITLELLNRFEEVYAKYILPFTSQDGYHSLRLPADNVLQFDIHREDSAYFRIGDLLARVTFTLLDADFEDGEYNQVAGDILIFQVRKDGSTSFANLTNFNNVISLNQSPNNSTLNIRDINSGDGHIGIVGITAVNKPCSLVGWSTMSSSDTDSYIKIYNKANPTAADEPLFRIKIPAGATEVQNGWNIAFSTCLSWRLSAGPLDTDNTPCNLNTIDFQLFYK